MTTADMEFSKQVPKSCGSMTTQVHPNNLGPQTSQYAEIAAILITLELAARHYIEDLLICTDSNYARLSFTCHLQHWKKNGFRTSENKPVKHQNLIQACDYIVINHNIQVYWKKVRGHSRLPGPDKTYNDRTDALAKAGALYEDPWEFWTNLPTHSLHVVTRGQTREPSRPPANSFLALSPQITADDIVSFQKTDAVLGKLYHTLQDPSLDPPDTGDRDSPPDLQALLKIRSSLRITDGVLLYVPDEHTSPRLVVPQAQRGVMLQYAHHILILP